MPDGTSRFSIKEAVLHHGTSTFSEYTVLPEISLAKINPKAPLDKVCLLGCGITTGIGAVLNTAKVRPGSTVAVFGLGGIGLSVVQGAVMAKASRIIAVDLNPGKWTMAKSLGATDYVNPKDYDKPVQQVIVDLTNGGVDYSFECIGNVHVMRSHWSVVTRDGANRLSSGVPARDRKFPPARSSWLRVVWRGSAFGGSVKGRSLCRATWIATSTARSRSTK